MSVQRTPPPTYVNENGPTPKQLDFISSLAGQKELNEEQRLWLEKNVPTLSKKKASEVIERLLKLPNSTKVIQPSVDWPDIAQGRYAVVDPDDGILKFYRVDRPTEGRWAGYIFLKVQASNELHPIKATDYKKRIFEEIAKDPLEAMKKYGQEIGACAICGRTLTDKVSRAYGIGPVCRGGGRFIGMVR